VTNNGTSFAVIPDVCRLYQLTQRVILGYIRLGFNTQKQMKLFKVICLWALVCPQVFAVVESSSSLYYSVASGFDSNAHPWETRLWGGYVFSDPYSQIWSARLEQLYSFDRTFAFGVGGGMENAQARSSTAVLEKDLGPYGFGISTTTPRARAYAIARLTPLTGLLNFFSERVVPVDIALVFRAGTSLFTGDLAWGPYLGTGVEIRCTLSPTWGLQTALNWETEHPNQRPWQSHVGFMVGPSARF
jgi:hypothetical protein